MLFRPSTTVFARIPGNSAAWLTAALLITAGCGKSHPPQKLELTAEEKAAKERKEVPGAISGKGWIINIKSVPQKGDGPMETVLEAEAATGLVKDPHDLSVQLTGVNAKLFQNGQHTASIKAPEASANQRNKTLVATGGVTVTSITDPPDTVVTSDKLYWNAQTNQMVAVGNAHAVMHTPEGKIRSTSGDRLTFDTRLKEITNE